jgi:nitroimidazol reductase NimA-like FMN-containing flavoprotein (pyridoxamine 5'-phosphate oxidase superfamily)
MVGDQPLVLPVNFVVDAGTVVLRTGVGAKLHNAPLTKVAFEVDHIDEQRGSGWSVVIQGVAQDITTGIDSRSEQLRSLAPEPWAEGERDHYVRVVPREISGRRVER